MRSWYFMVLAGLLAATVARADTFHYDYSYQNQTSTFSFTYDSDHLITSDETITPTTCQLYTTCTSISIDPAEGEIFFNSPYGSALELNNLPASFFTLGQHTSFYVGTDRISITEIASAPTPEPSGLALVGTGLLAMAGIVRRRLA